MTTQDKLFDEIVLLKDVARTLRAQVERLQKDNDNLRGAMKAQDEREMIAGERCGVSAIIHGCDWPGLVADRVIELEHQKSILKVAAKL